MKKIMGLYLFCLTFLWVSVASAKSLYVSVNGADKHTGEIDQPLRTIRVALNRAQPGDTIIIGPGTYRETIRASKKRDLTIKATREGDVQIVGTELLPQAWSEGDGGIWSQTLSQPIWQLFHEDAMAYVARWPNATFEDGKIWRMMAGYRSADGGYDSYKGKWIGKTRFGHLYDDRFHKPDSNGFREGDSRFMIDPTITFEDQPPSLHRRAKILPAPTRS